MVLSFLKDRYRSKKAEFSPFLPNPRFLAGNIWQEKLRPRRNSGRILKSIFMKCAQDWYLSNGDSRILIKLKLGEIFASKDTLFYIVNSDTILLATCM